MFKFTTQEDQIKFVVPMNKDTENIFYNQRMIIDIKTENPRCWLVSKVNRLQSEGCLLVTLAQDIFDSHRDYIERDEFGKIIGMWADYYPMDQYSVEAEEQIPHSSLPDYHIKLVFGGVKPALKVRGNYKKITATFLDKYENVVENVDVDRWKIELDGTEITTSSDETISFVTSDDDVTLSKNQIKIKTTSDKLLGKIVSVTAIKGGVTAKQSFEIVGM